MATVSSAEMSGAAADPLSDAIVSKISSTATYFVAIPARASYSQGSWRPWGAVFSLTHRPNELDLDKPHPSGSFLARQVPWDPSGRATDQGMTAAAVPEEPT